MARKTIRGGGALTRQNLGDLNDNFTELYSGGGSGAPTDATYVTTTTNSTLTNERVLTAGSGITLTDAGAGSTLTIASTGGAPTTAQYVTLATDSTLTAERVLTAGSGITLTDGGAGSTLTIAATGGGSGDVVGPGSATDGAPALFDTTTGKLLKNSTPTGTGNPVLQGTPTLTTPILGTPTSGTLTNCTGLPVAGIVASTSTALGVGSLELGAASDTTLTRVSAGLMAVEGKTVATLSGVETFTNTQTFQQIVFTDNAITASGNAATVPITSRLNTVTNNSAATLTITMTTTSAVTGQMAVVRILDASGATQTITWVNTENSTVTAPTTSNGSTTLPLTVGFMYNTATSKWRCIASA